MVQRIRQLWKRFKQLSTTEKAALAFLVLGAIIVAYGYFFSQVERDWRGFVEQIYSNLGIELVSVGLTVLVIESLNRGVATRERKQELILQMGSPDNGFAIEAVRLLRQKGWLLDGSLINCDLAGANLTRANLNRALMIRAHLKMANLSGALLIQALLENADLSKANLANANLTGAFMDQVLLFDANLSGAILSQAHLKKAKLYNANLNGAELKSADLRGAYLDRADLRGADLTGADLRGASLGHTYFDETTRIPTGAKWTPHKDMLWFTNTERQKAEQVTNKQADS